MSHYLILLTPVLIVLIVAAFGFTGCAEFTAAPEPPPETQPAPPPDQPPGQPPVTTPPGTVPPVAPSYKDVISATGGFAALWPLNESSGNTTSVVGPLNPQANGVYTTRSGLPAGSGYTLGAEGVLFAKDNTDHAPEFNGQGAFVHVQFVPQLNTANNVPFTVELWVKPNVTSVAAEQVLVSSRRIDSATADQGYEIRLVRDPSQTNHEIHARLFANGQANSENKILPLTGDPAAWRHIVFVYEEKVGQGWTITLHVRLAGEPNGYQDGPHVVKYQNVTSANPGTLRFGAGHATGQNPDRFFAGRIDNVAFYNAALQQGDIDSHFNMF